MNKFNYENTIIPESSIEQEPDTHVPIIDIIRHGRTNYKELKDPNFKFNPEGENFSLDTEHLDLNEDGIEDAKIVADQLLHMIDKENEVVVLTTSPNFRAHSTALVVGKILLGSGVFVVNAGTMMKISQLRQVSISEDRSAEWIAADRKYRDANPEHLKQPPDKAHQAIAESIGKDLDEMFTENYDSLNRRFEKYLRHMTNIYQYFNEDTKKQLGNKRVRIITLTHEEIPAKFMEKSLGAKENLKNGQILEIRPQSMLEEGKESKAQVILYAKPDVDSESAEAIISRKIILEEDNN